MIIFGFIQNSKNISNVSSPQIQNFCFKAIRSRVCRPYLCFSIMATGFMYTTIWIVHTYLSLDQHSQIKISDDLKAEMYSNNLNQWLKTAKRMCPLIRGGGWQIMLLRRGVPYILIKLLLRCYFSYSKHTNNNVYVTWSVPTLLPL